MTPTNLVLDLPAPPAVRESRGASISFLRAALLLLAALSAAGLLTVALIFRFWQLDRLPGVNGDEAWYGVAARQWLSGGAFPWRTPTRNIINPFYLLPLIGLHALALPSVALLRGVAAISGALALVVNYGLCRRAFDRRTAQISTVLLAVLPINLAYSRFGWDASQSLLFTLPVLYLPMMRPWSAAGNWRRLAAGMLALAAATWVHPTNIFAAPLVVLPWMMCRRTWPNSRMSRVFAACIGADGKPSELLVTGGLFVGLIAAATAQGVWHVSVPARAVSFVLNLVRLFSGATVYRFISGALPDMVELPTLADLDGFDAFAILWIGLAIYGFVRQLRSRWQTADVCLAWSVPLVLLGFFIVAGPAALQPHFERYALVLIAPCSLLLPRGITWWTLGDPRRSALTLLVATACGWLLLAGYWSFYWREFDATGGAGHLAFRTARVEPKAQTLDVICRSRAEGGQTTIAVDDWWLYWPLRYLASGDPSLRVVDWQDLSAADLDNSPAPGAGIYSVQFIDQEKEDRHAAQLRSAGRGVERSVICDQAGQPLISLLKSSAPPPAAASERAESP